VSRFFVAVVVLASLSFRPEIGLAQRPTAARQGASFSVGVGQGSARLTCTDCVPDRQSAPSYYVSLAGALRPNLVVGAAVDVWTKRVLDPGPDGYVRFTVATLDVIGQWYPQPSAGFFVSGGLGYGTIDARFDVSSEGSVSDRTSAFGYQLGAGYDLRVRRGFSLTPFVKMFGTASGAVEGTGAKLDAHVAEAGLGLTWH